MVGKFWLHFDVEWTSSTKKRSLVQSRRLVGLSVADFVPDKDPDGRYVRRLVELIAGLLAPQPENT